MELLTSRDTWLNTVYKSGGGGGGGGGGVCVCVWAQWIIGT